METNLHRALAHKLAQAFTQFPAVEAVALGGSQAGGMTDPTSDIDLYVFTRAEIPLAERAALVERFGASRADLNLQFWDLGDEWIDAETGIEVDVIYWDTRWIEDQLERLLVWHQPSLGSSTCFWHTLRNIAILYHRSAWLAGLQQQTKQDYPAVLRDAVIAKNHAVLRRVIPSYLHQIEKAARRGDLVNLNHRVAALLASYFDVLFALNRELHPGEKRLVKLALEHCALLPREMAADVQAVLQAAATTNGEVVARVGILLDHLDALLLAEGFDPYTSRPMAVVDP